jgi:hypothetical protein
MRKVCIIGTTPSAEKAPYDDESWEIWGVSERHDYVTRLTRWFEMHDWRDSNVRTAEWIAAQKANLERISKDAEIWDRDRVPVEKIKSRFGTYFLTSTIAWMMALAIDEEVDELMLWGVDMEDKIEYTDQRAGAKHFIGLAKFAGIKVHLDGINGIAYDPVPYPFWQDDPLVQKTLWQEKLQKQDLAKLEERLSEVEKRIIYLSAVTSMGGPNNKGAQKELDDLYAQLPKLNMDVAGCKGQLMGTQRRRNFLKP